MKRARAAEIEAFLRKPDPAVQLVLLHGPDAGLVRERADRLAGTVVPDLHDPFRVARVSGAQLLEDPARLADEAAAIAMGGGRRVVRVVDAGNRNAELIEGFLRSSARRCADRRRGRTARELQRLAQGGRGGGERDGPRLLPG
jgi:DNA polymerase-3 subunit delta